jgi:hypothetical protein
MFDIVFALFIPCIVTKLDTYITQTNALFCMCSYYLSHSCYMFRRCVTPSSGSWRQSFTKLTSVIHVTAGVTPLHSAHCTPFRDGMQFGLGKNRCSYAKS